MGYSVSLYVILITQKSSPKCLSLPNKWYQSQIVCGEGGDVFMVPTQRGQRKPKWPTHKDPREKRKKRKVQQRNIANGAK